VPLDASERGRGGTMSPGRRPKGTRGNRQPVVRHVIPETDTKPPEWSVLQPSRPPYNDRDRIETPTDSKVKS